MLHKSNFYDSSVEKSHTNASWDSAHFAFQTSTSSARSSSIVSPRVAETKQAPPSVRNLLLTRKTKEDARISHASPLKRKRPTDLLIEPDKMQRLLDSLRSNEFAGKIDLEHHSHYFEPPLSHAMDGPPPYRNSMTLLEEARKKQFKVESALQATKEYSRSHAAFS